MIYFEYHAKVKPYVRMTRRGKYVKPEAQEYLASKDALALAMKNYMQTYREGPFPNGVAFAIEIGYTYSSLYNYDLDNLIKAVLDAGNGVMWCDDRYCSVIIANKQRERGRPRLLLRAWQP